MEARHTEDAPNAGDDLDSIFGYAINESDTRALSLAAAQAPGTNGSGHGTNNGSANQTSSSTLAAGLGLNEEVKITKRREPIAKLDEERLLSQAGIPKLRVLAREKLVLKGKGHEFDDVSRMLEMYQLWMDDLYPRAKMVDALTIIEKLGHSKRMQMLRKDWINEGKPKDSVDEIWPDEADGRERTDQGDEGREASNQEDENPFANLNATNPSEAIGEILRRNEDDSDDDDGGLFVSERPPLNKESADDVPMDDDLDALLAEDGETAATKPHETTEKTATNATSDNDMPMGDELDALLAEDDDGEPNQTGKQQAPAQPTSHEEDFADDMEVMKDMW